MQDQVRADECFARNKFLSVGCHSIFCKETSAVRDLTCISIVFRMKQVEIVGGRVSNKENGVVGVCVFQDRFLNGKQSGRKGFELIVDSKDLYQE